MAGSKIENAIIKHPITPLQTEGIDTPYSSSLSHCTSTQDVESQLAQSTSMSLPPPLPIHESGGGDNGCKIKEPIATEGELRTLRRVPGRLPLTAYTITFVEFCERMSYCGTTAVC
jgi:hypothetical protein